MFHKIVKTLTEMEVARIRMLIGALYDMAEIERNSPDHDKRISINLIDIAKKLEKIIGDG